VEQALEAFEEAAISAERRNFLDDSTNVGVVNVIRAGELAGQFALAERWRRKWLAAVEARDGTQSLESASEWMGLAMNLLAQKKWVEAETPLRSSLKIQAELKPKSLATIQVQIRLGRLLVKLQKHKDAEPLLRQGYEDLKQLGDEIPDSAQILFIEALDGLIESCDTLQKMEDANKWRELRKQYPTE